MRSLPGIAALIILVLLRPQEFVPALEKLPLLHVAILVAAIGIALDVVATTTKLQRTPITAWAIAFLFWCAVTLLLKDPGYFSVGIQRILICVVFCLVIAHGFDTPLGLHFVSGIIFVSALALGAVGVHQGFSEKQCLVTDETERVASGGTSDGRLCDNRADCYAKATRAPGAAYICERVGLFGTSSIDNGRVRYRGILRDPNELALTLGIALPLAFARRQEKKGLVSTLMAVLGMVLITVCIIFTRSRGGQLVLLAVLGCYFVVKVGFKGVIGAGVLAVPALIYGGRGDSRAGESTTERLECWYAGLDMFKSSPGVGVGHTQFTRHHYLTAHNSYLLSLSEMGLPGIFIFVGLLYAAAKVPFCALKRYTDPGDPRRAWAIALLAALSGLLLGSFFLSFSYHHVLWLFVGLAGAFFGVVSRGDEGFKVTMESRDYMVISATCVVIIAFLFGYTRLKV